MRLIENVKLMNQISEVVKSILTTNQITMDEFKDAFITGKAKLITLFNNSYIVPFLFINYNGENFNTNISLETISELFEKSIDLEELNKMIISYL